MAPLQRLAVALVLLLGDLQRVHAQRGPDPTHWVSAWGSAQQIPESNNALPAGELRDATVRQIVHLSVGGGRLRLHISNAFGTQPLRLDSVHMARALSASRAAIAIDSDRRVTFGGEQTVTIPAGAEYLSDAIDLSAPALSDLAVSIHYIVPPTQQTGHPGSRATTYFASGNQTGAMDLRGARTVEHWYQISGIDVANAEDGVAIVALGDSITDGHGATTNGNDRWTDILAQRLQAGEKTRGMGMINAGIGGGRVLLDGLGPNLLARFDRDVLARSAVKYVIVFEGVNDLGTLTREGEKSQEQHRGLTQAILAAYAQTIARGHDHGLKVIGATITPFSGSEYYHPGPLSEEDRQRLNTWIRASGHFDGILDFDQVLRDPSLPGRMLPAYDSGDHLHPSPAGYKAMGDSIPLDVFR